MTPERREEIKELADRDIGPYWLHSQVANDDLVAYISRMRLSVTETCSALEAAEGREKALRAELMTYPCSCRYYGDGDTWTCRRCYALAATEEPK